MFTRMNFLLGLGLLLLILFYFGFRYLVIAPVAAFAPNWAMVVAGAAVLASVGFTVQILAQLMGTLAGAASYPQRPNAAAIASQAAIVCGHGALAYGASAWLREGIPLTPGGLLLVGGLYLAGVGLGLVEWRMRGAPRGIGRPRPPSHPQ